MNVLFPIEQTVEKNPYRTVVECSTMYKSLELGLNLKVVFLTFPIVSKCSYVITIFQNGLFLQKNSLESLETVKSVKNSSENLLKMKYFGMKIFKVHTSVIILRHFFEKASKSLVFDISTSMRCILIFGNQAGKEIFDGF